jgi:hypothetical protein
MNAQALAACVLLTAAATAAIGAGRLSIDDIAGVYKHQFKEGMVDGPDYMAEDVLEIVKLSSSQAYIRTRLMFYNGHICAIYGIAKVDGDALVYRASQDGGEKCVLTLRRAGDRIVFSDNDLACKRVYCGSRGEFDAKEFAVSNRRPIRYMKRLLASREYGEAIAERDRKR